MKRLASCLWFAKDGERAARFYCSVFKGKIRGIWRYGKAGPGKPGSVMFVEFEILGMPMQALNAGPVYEFCPAISFSIPCKDQKEVDYYWKKLTAGGKEVQCGWLVDKFGVSWQVVPEALMRFQRHKDPALRERVMRAMMGMVKLDVAGLERAAEAA
jgi:predicted 3-demethylubiquinone-9 3-methyltransferase (glyoxalase superfamily)